MGGGEQQGRHGLGILQEGRLPGDRASRSRREGQCWEAELPGTSRAQQKGISLQLCSQRLLEVQPEDCICCEDFSNLKCPVGVPSFLTALRNADAALQLRTGQASALLGNAQLQPGETKSTAACFGGH